MQCQICIKSRNYESNFNLCAALFNCHSMSSLDFEYPKTNVFTVALHMNPQKWSVFWEERVGCGRPNHKTNQRTEICKYKIHSGSNGNLMAISMFQVLYLNTKITI